MAELKGRSNTTVSRDLSNPTDWHLQVRSWGELMIVGSLCVEYEGTGCSVWGSRASMIGHRVDLSSVCMNMWMVNGPVTARAFQT